LAFLALGAKDRQHIISVYSGDDYYEALPLPAPRAFSKRRLQPKQDNVSIHCQGYWSYRSLVWLRP